MIPAPILYLTRFDTKNFLKQWTVPLQKVSVLWDIKNRWRTLLSSPFYAWKFSILEFFWSTEATPTKFFGTVRQQTFDGKLWCPPLSFSLILNIFRYRNFFQTQKGSLRNFSVLWDETLSTESRDTPLLSIKFFDTPNWWNTKGFPYQTFWHCERENFWRKFVIIPAPFLIPNIFRYQKFSEAEKVSTVKFFGTVRQQIFDGKSWCPPLSLIFNIFWYQKFSETQKGSSTKFLGTVRLSTENRDTLLQKVQKSVVELIFVKNLWKLNSKQ